MAEEVNPFLAVAQTTSPARAESEQAVSQGKTTNPFLSVAQQSKGDFQDRNLFDVTAGAFAFGAADVGEAVSKRVDRAFSTDALGSVVSTLDDFKKDHPEFSPKQVDGFWNLVRDPAALSGQLFSSAPYMLANIGLEAASTAAGVPWAGPILAGSLSYAVESQGAYEKAVASGASEKEAKVASEITGVVNAGLQMLRVGQIVGFSKAGAPTIAETAVRSALGMAGGLKLAGPALKHAAVQSLEMALQGAVRDGTAYNIYGLDEGGWEGFVDRRLQEMVGGAVAAEVFGIAGRPFEEPEQVTGAKVVDNTMRQWLRGQAIDQYKMTPQQADSALAFMDARASVWAKANDRHPEEFYTATFAKDKGDANVLGVYFQEPQQVQGFYSKLENLVNSEEFDKSFGKGKAPASSIMSWLQNKGIKNEELVWTGLGGEQGMLTQLGKPEINGKVGKQELVDYIGKNRVVLETTLKTQNGDPALEKRRTEIHQRLYDLNQEKNVLHDKLESLTPEESSTFQKLNDEAVSLEDESRAIGRQRAASRTRWGSYTTPGEPHQYEELLIRLPQDKVTTDVMTGEKQNFKWESHFEENNVLVHLRADVRDFGADKTPGLPPKKGESTYYIEELQSDWHQQGGQYGYALGLEDTEKPTLEQLGYKKVELRPYNLKEHAAVMRDEVVARAKTEAVAEHWRKADDKTVVENAHGFQEALNKLGMSQHSDGGASIVRADPDEINKPFEYVDVPSHHLQATVNDIYRSHFLDVGQTGMVPDAPFKDNAWVPLGLKHALLRAIEAGAQRIGWATGDEQRRRYPGAEGMDTVAKHYDKEIPKQLLKIVQKWDKGAKVEYVPSGKEKSRLVVVATKSAEEISTLMHKRVGYDVNKSFLATVNDKLLTLGMTYEKAVADVTQTMSEGQINRLSTSMLEEAGIQQKVEPIVVPTISLSPAIHRGIIDEGFPLFYPNKASTTILSDGRAIITALEKADASSFIHEIGHVLRRQVEGEDLKLLESTFGVKDGNWDIPSEEKFAKSFERYILDGKAPSGELSGAFGYLKDAMVKIYRKSRSYFSGINVTSEVREVMDRLLVEDSPTVSAHRQRLQDIESKIGFYERQKDEYNTELQKLRLAQATKDLERAQQRVFDPRQKSDSEMLAAEDLNITRPAFDAKEWSLTRRMRGIKDSLWRTFVSMSGPLMKIPAGQRLIEGLNQRELISKMIYGEYGQKISEVVDGLTKADKEFLATNKDGFSGFRRLNDPAGVPEAVDAKGVSIGLRNYFALNDEVGRRILQEAVKRGTIRKLPSGSMVPATESAVQRLPRVLNAEGHLALEKQSGPVFDAWVDLIKKHNPSLDHDVIKKDLAENYGPDSVRRVGSLEQSRRIKFMPDVVTVGGKDVAVMHMEPYQAQVNQLEFGSKRIGMIEQFGQGVMKNVSPKMLRIFAKETSLVEPITAAGLREQLKLAGLDPSGVDKLKGGGKTNPASLKFVAEMFGLKTGYTIDEIKESLMNKTVGDFDKSGRAELRRLAKSIRGIDDRGPIENVLLEVKKRVSGEVVDRMDQLRKQFASEGGDVRHFDNVLKVAQGLPFGWIGGREFMRTTRFISNLIGGAQTSTSVAPNVPQTIIQVPRLAGIGNYLEAVKSTLSRYDMTRAQLQSLGAITDSRFIWSAEPGQRLENIGRVVRNVIASGTGQRWIGDRNNVIAGESFRLFADGLRQQGAEPADLKVLKQLGINAKKIEEVRAGKMSDSTFAEIVQQGVAKTQYTTEAAYNRGYVENVPLLKILFSYNSYAAGTMRNSIEWAKDIKSSLSSGDPKLMFHAGKQLTMLIGASMGAGYVSQVLRQAIKGEQVKGLDQDTEDRLLGALVEVQLLGPTQRMIDPFRYDGGVVERAMIGTMPQVKVLGDLLGAMLGYGRYGDFPIGRRFGEVAKMDTPLYKAVDHYVDGAAYPELSQYVKAKAAATKFERDVLGRDPKVSETQIDPVYNNIFKYAQRYDVEGTQEAVKEFFNGEYQKRLKFGDVGPEPIRALRQSLVARAPLNMNPLNLARFLQTLPDDERQSYVKAHLKYMAIVDASVPKS